MSSDRFNFLEFGEQEPADGEAPPETVLQPIQRSIQAERLSDGTALAGPPGLHRRELDRARAGPAGLVDP